MSKTKSARNKGEVISLGENTIYLTADDLVERYRGQIHKRTLANWRSNGQGPKPTKIGGRILYSLEEVLKWESIRTGQYFQ